MFCAMCDKKTVKKSINYVFSLSQNSNIKGEVLNNIVSLRNTINIRTQAKTRA